jgi:hypothetical protein
MHTFLIFLAADAALIGAIVFVGHHLERHVHLKRAPVFTGDGSLLQDVLVAGEPLNSHDGCNAA